MNFREAFAEMKAGNKVKLPSWGGYWYWDKDKKTIMMHCRQKDSDTDKEVLDIRETQRVEYTLGNILSDEWEIAHEGNTPVLGGVASFTFSDALKYLKRGLKLQRMNWNGKDQYIMLHDPYDNNEYQLTEKEPSGTMYPHLVIKTNYNGIVPWFPSATDLLADDWVFVN